jgi:hypothetical protein
MPPIAREDGRKRPHAFAGAGIFLKCSDQSRRNTTDANQPVRIAIMAVAKP